MVTIEPHVEELPPVLPDRTRPRSRRRPLVAPHRQGAPRVRAEAVLGPRQPPRRLRHEHPRRPAQGSRAARSREQARLPPPAASTVYELTPYGEELRAVVHSSRTGARGRCIRRQRPTLHPAGSRRTAHGVPAEPDGRRIEFRIGDESRRVRRRRGAGGPARAGRDRRRGDANGLYRLSSTAISRPSSVEGSRDAVAALVAALPPARTKAALAPRLRSRPMPPG